MIIIFKIEEKIANHKYKIEKPRSSLKKSKI